MVEHIWVERDFLADHVRECKACKIWMNFRGDPYYLLPGQRDSQFEEPPCTPSLHHLVKELQDG